MKRVTRKRKNISGKATCDICKVTDYLEEHHIQGRNIKNPHNANNIACVCPSCHTKIHMGDIVIEKWALTTSGRELLFHRKNEKSFTGDDSTPYIIGNTKV